MSGTGRWEASTFYDNGDTAIAIIGPTQVFPGDQLEHARHWLEAELEPKPAPVDGVDGKPARWWGHLALVCETGGGYEEVPGAPSLVACREAEGVRWESFNLGPALRVSL